MGFLATPEFWVAAAFVGFVALVIYMKAPGMVARALDERADAIRSELEGAQRLREEAQAMLADYQRRQRDAEKEAADIVAMAARVSSRRRRGARPDRRGAWWKRSASPRFAAHARSRSVAMNRSSEAFDSDSVGSISMAPWTTSGKYMVIGW
jgi:hypothetical protein